MTEPTTMHEGTSCETCPLHSRRDFLRDLAASVVAAIGAGALLPTVASALAVHGTERRYAIPAADAVTIDAEAEVILARVGTDVFAFSLACPHQRTALRWEAANARFRCPKHKSTFRPDGSLVEGRAKRPMDRYAIRRDGNALVVDDARVLRSDQHPADWAAAVVRLAEK